MPRNTFASLEFVRIVVPSLRLHTYSQFDLIFIQYPSVTTYPYLFPYSRKGLSSSDIPDIYGIRNILGLYFLLGQRTSFQQVLLEKLWS